MARKHLLVLCLAALMVTGISSLALAGKDKTAAVKAAEKWLALVDAGKFAESWKQAAAFFRKAVPQESWVQQVGAARKPLGKVLSRNLKSADFHTSLPGAPDGKYYVIQYNTSFANKRSAVETITPMPDKDGTWRVSGYYIK